MSAPDFTARALAVRAAAQSPLTFAELAQARLPASVRRIESSGHTAAGLGAGSYVSDSLATAALAAAHPLAVFAGAEGRWFRLIGNAEGFIAPEQLGCPAYAAGTNQRLVIQAALDYCKAVGLKGVIFPQQRYELWVGLHVGSFTDAADHTGNHLVVDQWACSLVSTHPLGTVLDCKGPTGGNKLTDYQVINSATYGGDVIWRGAAIKLTGTVNMPGFPNPGDAALSHLAMRGITFFTGITASLNSAWPCHPPSRTPGRENAWDISNKGIWCQNDKHVGNITLIDSGFDGFLGEHIYCGGGLTSNQRLVVRNYTSRNTNGSSFNPNGPRSVDVNGAYCENAIGVIEGWLGWEYGRFVNVHAKGCGSGGELKGGYEYSGAMRSDGTMPRAQVDVLFENCGRTYLGNFLSGRVHLIDGWAEISQQSSVNEAKGINIDLIVTAHSADVTSALRVLGDPTGTNQFVRNNTVRLDIRRSKEAQDANRRVVNVYEQKFPTGPANYIYARGHVDAFCAGLTSVSGNYVALIDQGLNRSSTSAGAMPFDPTTTASPDWGYHALRPATFSGGAGVYSVNLPATTMYQEGDEISIEHIDGTKTAHFVELVDAGTKKALVGFRDRVRLRCNRTQVRWDVIQAPAPRSAAASIDIAATAAGAESGPYVIALPGCRPWHRVEVMPPALLTGFVISAVRGETDQVKFWVRNIDGGATLDPAAQTFTARCSIPG